MAVLPIRVGNLNQVMHTTANTCSDQQFVRELLYNGVQAVQRVGKGDVYVDYTLVDGIPKMRFWDTGDGMTRADLLDRIATYGAQDRTGTNFGVGAKVSLVHVSPHGAVFTTVRDGAAHRMTLAAAGGDFGPVITNPDAATELEQVTEVLDLADPTIPDDIRKAGHGTVVTLLGAAAADATWLSLAPENAAQHWLAHLVNDRFARFPAGVNVHVQEFNPNGKSNLRAAKGVAAHADFYIVTGAEKTGDVDVDGARGTLKLSKTIPATVHWWVMPTKKAEANGVRGKDPSSLYRIGGRVRVVIGDEVYLVSDRLLREAGIHGGSKGRIEIQVVPDPGADVAITADRSTARIDGQLVHDAAAEWCAELAGKLPTAIFNLQGVVTSRTGDTHKAKIEDLYSGLGAFYARSARAVRRAHASGQLVEACTSGVTSADPKEKTTRMSKLKARVRDLKATRTSAAAGDPSTPGTVERVTPDENGTARAIASRPVFVAPEVVWLNDSPENRDADLDPEKAGYYVAHLNKVYLNADFVLLATLIEKVSHEFSWYANSKPAITEHIREAYARQMRSLVTGVHLLCAGNRDKIQERLTDEALTTAACELREVDNRTRQWACKSIGTARSAAEPQAA